MRKTGRAIVSLILLVAMVFTAVSCGGGLSGTYISPDGKRSVTFSGDQVTMSNGGFDVNGKYKINGDMLTLSFEIAGQTVDENFSFSQSENTITLDGQKFTR